jgi:predicted DNA-binding helix-hairpin-helix protein
MNSDRITEKLSILADAAKYDVSCASSGNDIFTSVNIAGRKI